MQDIVKNLASVEEVSKLNSKAPVFELGHIGINTDSKEEAEESARMLCMLFNLSYNEKPISYFSGTEFEVINLRGRGAKGHIALRVESVPKAMEYLAAKGVTFIPETRKFDDKGNCTFIYLTGEVGGFALHLVQK